MGTVLIAMLKSEDGLRIEKMLRSRGVSLDTEICMTGAEILRTSNDRDFGVVICTKRLKDMNYTELSEYLPVNFGMIVITNDVSLEMFSDRAVKLLLPFKGNELVSTINMLTAHFYRRKKKKSTVPKKRNEEEQKKIDRAKMILMERNGMSEPEAFRYIQKSSMDMGRSMVESAEMILLMDNT